MLYRIVSVALGHLLERIQDIAVPFYFRKNNHISRSSDWKIITKAPSVSSIFTVPSKQVLPILKYCGFHNWWEVDDTPVTRKNIFKENIHLNF